MKEILLSLLVINSLFSANFVLQNDKIVLEKAVNKIEEMASELKEKTGVGIYLYAIDKLDNNETITKFANRVALDLNGSYALIVVSRIDKQIEMKNSPDLDKVLDKDNVLNGYIIPLFVEIRKDLTAQQQISAGILNGVAHIQDTIAENRGVSLTTSIGSESKNFYDGLMWVIKVMALLTIIALYLAWRRSRA